jgi:hypothetical protein
VASTNNYPTSHKQKTRASEGRDWRRFKAEVLQIANPHPAPLDSLVIPISWQMRQHCMTSKQVDPKKKKKTRLELIKPKLAAFIPIQSHHFRT